MHWKVQLPTLKAHSFALRTRSTERLTRPAEVSFLSFPVAAVLQVVLPRPQPRITADRLQRHLEEALAAVGAEQQQ